MPVCVEVHIVNVYLYACIYVYTLEYTYNFHLHKRGRTMHTTVDIDFKTQYMWVLFPLNMQTSLVVFIDHVGFHCMHVPEFINWFLCMDI